MAQKGVHLCGVVILLPMAVDPSTGDSVLHLAFATGRIDTAPAICHMFRDYPRHRAARDFFCMFADKAVWEGK
jgi:hypothetical protein